MDSLVDLPPTPVPHPPHSLIAYAEPILVCGLGAKAIMPPVPEKVDGNVVRVLNAVIPPREWTESDGSLWHQHAEVAPPTREDVVALQEKLDRRLFDRQARDVEICPVREELFSQTFDEIIRQITIRCPERGLLLLRVRDELRMTIAAYQTIYQSSTVFGLNSLAQSAEDEAALSKRADELTGDNDKLRARVLELRSLCEAIDQWSRQVQETERSERAVVLQQLTKQNQELTSFIESVST